MMLYNSAVKNNALKLLCVLAICLGCSDGDKEDGDDNDTNNENGYNPYNPYKEGGTSGPSMFVDHNNDGINDICADVTVSASRVTPTVTFVVDGSSSMDRNFQNSRDSRWEIMVSTLMSRDDGVVATLQSVVSFGMVLFSGPADNCPDLRIVEPALNNYDALNRVLSDYRPGMMPPKYTPTALALDAAYNLQPDSTIPDRNRGPHFIILCTDGNPNSCEAATGQVGAGDPPPEFDGPIQAVTSGQNKGIDTFVISLASEGPEYEQHLAQLAEIGNPSTPAFSPATRDALVAKMEEIVGGALGCNIALNGRVTPGQECTGQVELNSKVLGCNDPNGWRLVDERHIELLGSACDEFMNNVAAVLEAGFPCDVFDIEVII
ncbi:MAG: VWA domain-containing protein [Deltaproteobacteria bacterium]|nr:VWA domain-containing protein [Deltaproteobacteria bacterium]